MKKCLFTAALVLCDDAWNTAVDMVPIDSKTLSERNKIAYKSVDVLMVKVDHDLIYKVYSMYSEMGRPGRDDVWRACMEIEASIVEDELESKGELK